MTEINKMATGQISIHALLAESDHANRYYVGLHLEFLSTLSLRRATSTGRAAKATTLFLSTLSLRRATRISKAHGRTPAISIHALLAESDTQMQAAFKGPEISIHALLAESDGLDATIIGRTWDISIHALLAESDARIIDPTYGQEVFLSTLSLRRATWQNVWSPQARAHFYPRSPCGERPCGHAFHVPFFQISIHALLAESDIRW